MRVHWPLHIKSTGFWPASYAVHYRVQTQADSRFVCGHVVARAFLYDVHRRPAPTGRKAGAIRRSKTGLPGSWTAALNVTAGSYGYSSLTDVSARGKAGLLWEGQGGILFSTFSLEF